MKKLMLLIFLWLTAVALIACVGDSGRPDTVRTEPSPEAASNSAVPEMLEQATGTFTLTQGGNVIVPYECLLSADTYADGMWTGVEASLLPPWEMEERLPTVRFDATLGFRMSDNAEIQHIEVFDSGYERIHYFKTEDEFRTLNGNLKAGTYYVDVQIGYTGKYIQEEDNYNTSIYLYMFRLIVGDTTSEEELRREEDL